MWGSLRLTPIKFKKYKNEDGTSTAINLGTVLIQGYIGLSLICFYVAYYSILQFSEISPIILPNIPIFLLLFSLVTSPAFAGA